MKPSIYYFSSIKYDFLTQRPQQLVNEWRRHFGKKIDCYYVEPFQSGINLRRSAEPFVLRTPFYCHFAKYGLVRLEAINRYFIARMPSKCLRGERVAIVCTTHWEPYLDHSCFDIICYDYLDALEVHAGAGNFQLMRERHCRLVEKSDIVFVTAEKLRQEVLSAYPTKAVVMVSNGVDSGYFQQNCKQHYITDFHKSERAVAGYVGAIYDWIDLELVHASARLTPEIDYVMIGPISDGNMRLVEKKPENVYYLGPKPYSLVPAYIDLFDVALIPFVNSNISASTDPIKLYEYFALGKPVVATRMLQLVPFDDGLRLTIGDDAGEFAAEVRRFSLDPHPGAAVLRLKVANENSWTTKAEAMLAEIEKHINQKV